MASFFDIFYTTLKNENIALQNNELIPAQFYAENYLEFFAQIDTYKKQNNLKNFIILSDGQFKKSCVQNPIDIKDVFLQNFNANYHYIDLSQLCQVHPTDIHASEFFLKRLKEKIAQFHEDFAFIALGSGTITDLLKHALFTLNKKDCHFISIPTATTVTAFTSSFSVVDIDGAKRTRLSKNVNATFWCEPLLTAAPYSLIKAGFGDLLARFVAYGDWYLGKNLNMFDSYDEIAWKLMEPFTQFLACETMDFSLLKEMPLFTQTLAMAGVSMSLCKQTTPLSGYEHAISHGLDFLKLTSQKELGLHGEQVALATLTSALSFDWLLEQTHFDEKKQRHLDEKQAHSLIQSLLNKAPLSHHSKHDFNKLTEFFLEDYREKNHRWNERKPSFFEFNESWLNIKSHLRHLVFCVKKIEKILEKSELPLFPEAMSITAHEYRWAMRFAPFIRSRFCLADFIFWMGEDPCAIAAI